MKLQKLTIIMFALILTALCCVTSFAQSEREVPAVKSVAANDPFPFFDRRQVPTGAWDITGTTELQGNFKALLSFTGDGVVLADEPGGAFETTGHGNWVRNGNRFDYTFIAFIGSDNAGATAIIKVSGSVNLTSDAQGWDGPFKLSVATPGGTVLFQDQGTFKGKRVAIEPIN